MEKNLNTILLGLDNSRPVRVVLENLETDDWFLTLLDHEEKSLELQRISAVALVPLLVEAHLVGEAEPIAFAVAPQGGQVMVTPLEADGVDWVVADEQSFSGHAACGLVVGALLVGLRHPGVSKHIDEFGVLTMQVVKSTFLAGTRH